MRQTLELKVFDLQVLGKWGSLTPESAGSNLEALAVQATGELRVPGHLILTRLSYTHIEQLLRVENPLKRTFYEIEAIKGTWSVRELKRQLNSQLFERSGLSAHPAKLKAGWAASWCKAPLLPTPQPL